MAGFVDVLKELDSINIIDNIDNWQNAVNWGKIIDKSIRSGNHSDHCNTCCKNGAYRI